MNVLRARVLGFCMGVRRAVEMTEAAIAETALSAENTPAENTGSNPSIYTLGPLIHNPQVLDSLTKRGVKILEETEFPARDSVVIIRAHGVSPETEQKIREQGTRIIDATCPRVKASQNTALRLAEEGYTIFLAGEKNHSEIKGIYGYAISPHTPGERAFTLPLCAFLRGKKQNCVIVGNSEEADRAAFELKKTGGQRKTALIGQTTISNDEYSSIAAAIKKHFPNLEVKNTICEATMDRQDALRELCSAVDAVVIAGGKSSANTRRLLSIAQSCLPLEGCIPLESSFPKECLGKPAWLVETAADLPAAINSFKTIGLSAGASTPDNVIDEIERALL